MQYLTIQYLLAMESLKLLVMKLNILVADNIFNPCRYDNTKEGYYFALAQEI